MQRFAPPHPFAGRGAPRADAPPPWLAPSLLAADATRLGAEVDAVQRAGADWLHVDVMDGHFVPNLAFSPHVVAALRRACALPLDVHLMVQRPHRLFAPFAEAGADMLTFHVEAEDDVPKALAQVRAFGLGVGLSARPHTPLAALQPHLGDIDLLLVMGVQPGFGGQAMLEGTLERVRALAALRQAGNHRFVVQLDGGVHVGNAAAASAAGVDALVAGSAVFGAARAQDAWSGSGNAEDAARRYEARLTQLRCAAQTPKG